MVVRVESRNDWEDEQKLHTFPLSRYFIEEYAGFMMAFKKNEGQIEFNPVVVSQCAQQGNLREIAINLRSNRLGDITAKAKHYFLQLTDLCTKLIESGHYHPDIKLTNFLVDKYMIRISDRKTIIKKKNPLIINIQSSPLYSPPEFLECINASGTGYNFLAYRREADMEAFMAFQLGMALKEFLILTQMEKLPEEYREHDAIAASYFKSPTNAIVNYSILIQELTRDDPKKRLTIGQFQNLLFYTNHPSKVFYKELENVLPFQELGLQEEMDEITALLKSNLTEEQLLQAANLIFNKIEQRDPKEQPSQKFKSSSNLSHETLSAPTSSPSGSLLGSGTSIFTGFLETETMIVIDTDESDKSSKQSEDSKSSLSAQNMPLESKQSSMYYDSVFRTIRRGNRSIRGERRFKNQLGKFFNVNTLSDELNKMPNNSDNANNSPLVP